MVAEVGTSLTDNPKSIGIFYCMTSDGLAARLPVHEDSQIQQISDQFEKASSLANQLAKFLEAQMKNLNQEDEEGGYSEARIKTALLVSKGIQALEDLVKRMDTASHEANQYPQDLVEFSKKLEKQIAIITNNKTKKRTTKMPK